MAARPPRGRRRRHGPRPAPVRRVRACRRSCWSATTSGWRSRDSSGRWRSARSRATTRRPSSRSTPATPAACWPSWVAPSAGSTTRNGPQATRFLERAVEELAGPDGRVIPVRLTLLAEMLRHREWTPATLRDLGGFEGIGERFLEETFSAPTAPPAHRTHQRAAQAVLKALLPEPSSDLKGRMRPASALRQAAGYVDRPAEFAELMDLLDNELRMVTPVNPSAVGAGAAANRADQGAATPPAEGGLATHGGEETYYQLTHDYLVPPVRQWLTRKQRGTWRGRAELRLAASTSLSRDRPERRRLPSLPEWLMIAGLTRRTTWSKDERRMMRAATRYHLLRAAAAVLIACGLTWAVRRVPRARTGRCIARSGDGGRLRGPAGAARGAGCLPGRPPRETPGAGVRRVGQEGTPARGGRDAALPRSSHVGARRVPARAADVGAEPARRGGGAAGRAGGASGAGRGRVAPRPAG